MPQLPCRLIPLVRIQALAFPDHFLIAGPPAPSLRQLLQRHAQGIDVRPFIRLGKTVLFRRREPSGAQQLRILLLPLMEHAGDVEVDKPHMSFRRQ